MVDKICRLEGPAVPLTCGLNCNFPNSLDKRGLQLFCVFMESWSHTDGGGRAACSLHQTATEDVTTDSIMCKCRAGPTLTEVDCTCLITSTQANLMGLKCFCNGFEVRLPGADQGDYGTQEFPVVNKF